MGEEIEQTLFDPSDFDQFQSRLRDETRHASNLFARNELSETGYAIGFEVEAWLLDHGTFPYSINEAFLDALDHPLVVPKRSRFNVELNSTPLQLRGDVLRRATAELSDLWSHSNAVAHGLNANMVLIGTLPTLRGEDLSVANISPLKRYYELNREVLRQRHGRPLKIDIGGRERLVTEHRDVMPEAATTAFQIHLKTPARLAHRYYNASLMVSGPILAACANAPFAFGRVLWDETRIPLFEQAVDPLNDPPYGTERCYNALRLAHAPLKGGSAPQVSVFLMADAVAAARRGQKTPNGYYNVERMLRRVTSGGGQVLLCGTCMDARGIGEGDVMDGARRSTMDELAQETTAADKVLVFCALGGV